MATLHLLICTSKWFTCTKILLVHIFRLVSGAKKLAALISAAKKKLALSLSGLKKN